MSWAAKEFLGLSPLAAMPRFASRAATAKMMSGRSIYRFPFGKNALELAYLDRNLAETKDEERAEEAADPRQSEYDRMARNDYAQLHQRQIAYRDYIDDGTKRKLRKRKARSCELAWEEHSAGNVRGGALLIFPVDKLQAKRRIEMSDQLQSELPWTAKRHVRQRQFRKDVILSARDETFGSRTVAAYVVEPDGKCRWWTNFPGGG